jgi:hypothetical protein
MYSLQEAETGGKRSRAQVEEDDCHHSATTAATRRSQTFDDEKRNHSTHSDSSRGASTSRWVFFFVFWCDFCVMFVHERLKMKEVSQYAVSPVAAP